MDRREALKNTALTFGVVLSGSAISSMLTSCQQQDRLTWQPVFFDEEQAKTVSALCDLILPRTDTPSALDMKVDIFIDMMASKALSTEDQKSLIDGYVSFVASVTEKFGKGFLDLSASEKEEVMKDLGSGSSGGTGAWGSPIEGKTTNTFYKRVRQWCINGYFSSEHIGEKVLAYDPIPGDYKGCIPYTDQKVWSLG